MPKMLINAYQLKDPDIIRHIYILDGKVHKEDIRFKPFLGVRCNKEDNSSWTDMYGHPVRVKVFDSIMDMYKWKKENKSTIQIFGDIDVVDMFVATQYRGDIALDTTGLKIFNIDIETPSLDGDTSFPDPVDTKNPIVSITINDKILDKYYVFAFCDYQIENENETFIKCDDEKDLIKKFLKFWNDEDPQIITGWNIDTFDIPYLVNRIIKVCGPEEAKKLSVDRILKAKKSTDDYGNEVVHYTLQGHIIWDYIYLYKKYTRETRESYTLDNIASVELGENKIEYHDDYDNLNELYHNDPQKFIRYNIKDTKLVCDLDYKLDYINVALSIMHMAKCRPDKIFGTLAPWDCIYYNKLLSRKILCPPNTNHTREDFVGGFVGDPTPGLHEWLEVVDIVSSYPNQIRSLNLSLETAIHDSKLPPELVYIKNNYTGIDIHADLDAIKDIGPTLRKYNVSFTSNGYFFDISKEGIIPSIFTELFSLRKEYKRQLKEHKKAGNEREAKIADLYQYTIKILLNSGYGALSNAYSRYFDIRIGEAITSNGQVCCKGMSNVLRKKLNIPIVYNDTDSAFISLGQILTDRYGDKLPEIDNKTKVDFLLKYTEKFIEPCIKEFFVGLSKAVNMRELTIAVEPECIADVTLFTAKKRYIMNKLWDEGTFHIDKPKKKIIGIEIVRSSTPKIIREKLRECVDLIFLTKSNDALIDFIEKFRTEFKVLPIETISFPRSVSIGTYTRTSKSLPIGVKAALSYNDYLKTLKIDKKYVSIADGDKLKFCYIKQPNHVHSSVIGFLDRLPQEMKSTFDIDYEMMFQKSFLNPLENIFKAINWNIEKIQTLEDFFDEE